MVAAPNKGGVDITIGTFTSAEEESVPDRKTKRREGEETKTHLSANKFL